MLSEPALAGMIVIDNRSLKVKTDEHIMSFLETFANHAGMALQNAYLFDNLSRESMLRTATLKNLPVGVIVLDPSGEIYEFNYAMCQISNLSGIALLASIIRMFVLLITLTHIMTR